jgi:CubicO group peptidase (beta-lactamase class C family)
VPIRILLLVVTGALVTRAADISATMRRLVDSGTLPGAVTLVSIDGKLVHHQATGYADLERKIPMRRDTIFEVMSMTKPVTAAAILLLAEEGRLGLTDPVAKHLPEFRGQMVRAGDRLVAAERPITIYDLLTHTSGLAEMPPAGMGGADFYRRLDKTLAEAVTLYSQMPLQFQPGTSYQYSNPGMATLGRIIETVSGQPYERFVDERIFQPLGMTDSFFYPDAARAPRIAQVYLETSGKLVPGWPSYLRPNARYPMPEGGLYSTATDMAAFFEMLRRRGKPILSPAAVETIPALHTATGPSNGLALRVNSRPQHSLNFSAPGAFGHAGAFGTYAWVDPARRLTGVFLIQYFGPEQSRVRDIFVEMATSLVEDNP